MLYDSVVITGVGLDCAVFLRPLQHSIGYMGDGFTGQKTQPTVSKYWRKKLERNTQTTHKTECTQKYEIVDA